MNNQSVKPFSEPKRKAVIIGGGLAGMVVADELLKAGMQVLIIEKSPRMGGKAGADRINGVYEEHGYHVFPPWYANTLKLIDEIGAAGNLVHLTRFHYLRAVDAASASLLPQKKKERLGIYPNTKEFRQLDKGLEFVKSMLHNIINSFIEWHKAALALYAVLDLCASRFKERCFLDKISVNGFLRSRFYTSDVIAEYHHQTVIQASAIPNYELSAMTLRNLVINWEPKRKPLLSIMNGNLQEKFIDPLEKHILARGAKIRTGTALTKLVTGPEQISKLVLQEPNGTRSDELLGTEDVCIITTPHKITEEFIDDAVFALDERNLPKRSEDAARPLGSVCHLVSAPMAAFHFYLRRKIPHIPSEHVNLFKSRFVLSFIDVSQHWDELNGSDRTVLSVIASDSKWLCGLSPDVASRAVYEEIRRYIPELKSWNEDVERVHPQLNRETPLFLNTVGAWHFRPGARTRIRNLYVAGDYCRSQADLTTMESAVMSAISTAAAVLTDAGIVADEEEAGPLRLRKGDCKWYARILKWLLRLNGKDAPPLKFWLAKWGLLPVVAVLRLFAGKKCQ